jgi:hypothetical protein
MKKEKKKNQYKRLICKGIIKRVVIDLLKRDMKQVTWSFLNKHGETRTSTQVDIWGNSPSAAMVCSPVSDLSSAKVSQLANCYSQVTESTHVPHLPLISP